MGQKTVRRLRDEVIRELEGEIASGQMVPGTSLNERSIGTRFGMSRTPAREVLLQLSAAGLVRFVPRHGAVVVGLTPGEVISMVEVLVALEGEASSLAARRMEQSERDDLSSLYASTKVLVECMSVEEYSRMNKEFHEKIYMGSRNRFLTTEIKALRLRLAPYLRHSFIRQGRMRSSHAEHGAVVAAIESYDEAGAAFAMRQHILNGGNLFADMLSKLASD